MSWQATAWVAEYSEARAGARCLMFALANHADEHGGNVWASVDTLGHEARLSRRGTQDALRRLERDGEIKALGKSQFGTTVYRIVGMGGADSAPVGGAGRSVGGAQVDAKRTSRTAPKRSTKRNNETTHDAGAREELINAATKIPDGRATLRALGDVAGEREVEFVPDDLIAEARRYPDRDHLAEAIRFRDYYATGGAGENAPVRSLRARWRTWLGRAPTKDAARNGGRRRARDQGPSSDELRAMAADLRARGL